MKYRLRSPLRRQRSRTILVDVDLWIYADAVDGWQSSRLRLNLLDDGTAGWHTNQMPSGPVYALAVRLAGEKLQ